jgi:dTDP-4-dehydrorhamnose 3,5-epimerase
MVNIKCIKTSIPGCLLLKRDSYYDNRGSFTKLYNEEDYKNLDILMSFKEQIVTFTTKYGIRGMHFQVPPFAQDKLITCITGTVLDVLLDLRKSSPTYGKFESIELSSLSKDSIFVPKGLAHGFISLENNSGVLYSTSNVYQPDYDKGVRWDSFGFEWPSQKPILSDRDKLHPLLDNFITPF